MGSASEKRLGRITFSIAEKYICRLAIVILFENIELNDVNNRIKTNKLSSLLC